MLRNGWGRWQAALVAAALLLVLGVGLGLDMGGENARTAQISSAPIPTTLPAPSATSANQAARVGQAPGSLGTLRRAELPVQGRDMLGLIYQGGPFKYDKDGVSFGNRERILPAQARAYYREYTVKTPGVSHRGARRIVCGGERPAQPDICYYTDDHYASFRTIVE